jgi:O-antigen ligase
VSFRGFALAGLVTLVGASALAFGSVEEWSSAWLRFGLLVVAFALVASGANRRSLDGATASILAPVIAVIALALIQSVPAPRPVIRLLSPQWARLQGITVPDAGAEALPKFLVAKAVAQGTSLQPGESVPRVAVVPVPVDGGRSLSVAPQATRRALLSWITAALGLICAAILARRATDLYSLLWGLAGWTGALGAIAIVTRASGTTTLMGLRPAPESAEVLGPFVNPNHFAAFTNIGVLAAFGLLFALLADSDGRVTRASIKSTLVDREWALPRLLVLGGCVVLGLVGLVISRSRAGSIAFAVGFLSLLAVRRLKGRFAVVVVAAVCVGLAVGLVSWAGRGGDATVHTPFAATSTDASMAMRWDIWGRTLQIAKDFPIVGSGLGTFRYAYTGYDRPGEWLSTDQAHNDYLQLVSETGILGAIALLWAVFVFLRRVVVPLARAATPFRWTTAGCLGAVVATLVHTVFDFSLQIPAVALEFAVTVGLLTAIATVASQSEREAEA